MNLRFSTVQLQTGPRLHDAEGGDPAGEPVLFLHGWPDSWFSFSRVLEQLPAGYRALAVDQRGFGDSERPERGYALRDFARDAVSFLDALSIERAAIAGHSFGSFVARQVAISHPDRVSRMALIGTAVSAESPVAHEVRAALQDLEDPVPPEFARQFQAGTAYAPLPEPFFERLVAESLNVPARLWREVFDAVLAHDDAEQLGKVRTPTLLIWGDRDPLLSREEQERMIRTIPGAQLKEYEETGHCPNWERPAPVAADLHAFLS